MHASKLHRLAVVLHDGKAKPTSIDPCWLRWNSGVRGRGHKREEKRGSNGVSDAVERDKRKTMAGRCLLSYSGGKIKRDLRATNPKSERRKRGSRSSRPTDGRTNGRNGQKDGWTERGKKARSAQVRTRAQGGDGDDGRPVPECLPAAAPTHHPSLHLKRADGGAEAGGGTEIKSMLQNARQSQHNQPQLPS